MANQIGIRLLLTLPVLMIVSACGDRDKAAGPAPSEKGIRVGVGGVTSEMLRDRKVAGHWQSSPGVFPMDRTLWLRIDVATDRGYTLEARGMGRTSEAVFASSRGKATWSEEGLLQGSGTEAKPPMDTMGSWTASFPAEGVMRLRSPDNTSFDLTYRGT